MKKKQFLSTITTRGGNGDAFTRGRNEVYVRAACPQEAKLITYMTYARFVPIADIQSVSVSEVELENKKVGRCLRRELVVFQDWLNEEMNKHEIQR